jgi:caffeoyl-CoA O-methyltransferase
LEIGTFTGYSSLCIARGLRPESTLICLDENEDWTRIARRYWNQAGLASRIDLRLGPALLSLASLEQDPPLDIVFIDADKPRYDDYYEKVLPLVRPGGLLLFDNMLWGGRILEKNTQDESALALHALNLKLTTDDRVDNVLLPMADGIQLCRKR